MPARIHSAALRGIEVLSVEVEVDILPGLPSFTLVGLTDRAIQESRERLTSALVNLGYTPPRRKTIVSLAPASLKKEGSLYDLPIAIGFLVASRQMKAIRANRIESAWFVGELGLDGTIRPVAGILPIVLAAAKAGIKEVYVPQGNADEAAAAADQLAVYAVASLQELITHISRTNPEAEALTPLKPTEFASTFQEPDMDFADIKGQEFAKRALLIAASASHNVLLVGPPGTGKTLLARALAGILPPLTRQESHVVTSLYSIAGLLAPGEGLIRTRPFRSPHHGASSVALVGGGTYPKPGEVSLAHQGVLFLDELPEFSRHVLEQLRQPIEDGVVTVSRAAHSLRFPARSMLVGAMNPCKCGFVGSTRRSCQCAAHEITKYQHRISGPLLDRFDLHVLVADIPVEELLSGERSGPTSAELAEVALQARERQWARQGKTNSALTVKELKHLAQIDDTSKKLLYQAEQRFHLSARGVHRLLKVALTIADITGLDQIQPTHVAEALQYREQLKAALPDFV
jgi:magnesium chelatase family protein